MDDISYRRARARVEARLGFYRHAAVYVAVNLFLAIWNLTRSPEHLWFGWPMFGWGIGLLAHGISVFSYRWRSAGKEQMIQRELAREERERRARGESSV